MNTKLIFLSNSNRACLSSFLLLMKNIGRKTPYRFFLVSEKASLIESISLKDNLMLDPMAIHLAHDKQFILTKHLKQSGNYFLLQLFKQLSNIDLLPREVTKNERVITILIKSILSNSQYLVLDKLEEYVDPSTLLLYKKALSSKYKNASKKNEIFIYSKNFDFWKEELNKIAIYHPKSGYRLEDCHSSKKVTSRLNDTKQVENIEIIELKRSA